MRNQLQTRRRQGARSFKSRSIAYLDPDVCTAFGKLFCAREAATLNSRSPIVVLSAWWTTERIPVSYVKRLFLHFGHYWFSRALSLCHHVVTMSVPITTRHISVIFIFFISASNKTGMNKWWRNCRLTDKDWCTGQKKNLGLCCVGVLSYTPIPGGTGRCE